MDQSCLGIMFRVETEVANKMAVAWTKVPLVEEDEVLLGPILDLSWGTRRKKRQCGGPGKMLSQALSGSQRLALLDRPAELH